MRLDSLRRRLQFHDNFQGIPGRAGGQCNGIGGLFQRKAMSYQLAHVEAAGEDEPGDFGLQCEIGRVAANEVFFVEADGGQIKGKSGKRKVESRNGLAFYFLLFAFCFASFGMGKQ